MSLEQKDNNDAKHWESVHRSPRCGHITTVEDIDLGAISPKFDCISNKGACLAALARQDKHTERIMVERDAGSPSIVIYVHGPWSLFQLARRAQPYCTVSV
jgi:hypothetical protein